MKCKRTIFIAATLCAIVLQAAAQDVESGNVAQSFLTPCTLRIMEAVFAAPAVVDPAMSLKETEELYDTSDTFYENALFLCGGKDIRTTLKQVATVTAMFQFRANESLRKHNDLVNNYNALRNNHIELLSLADQLVKGIEGLRQENRTLRMGQALLLRMYASSFFGGPTATTA